MTSCAVLTVIKQALVCGILAAGIIIGLQVSAYLAQVSDGTARMEVRIEELSMEARATMQYAQAVLSSVRGTTETIRKSAVEQMGYYESAGRRSALALARLELLITHTDARMERITQAVEKSSASADESMAQVGTLAASVRQDIRELSLHGVELIKDSTESVERVNTRLADARLDRIAESLAESSEGAAQAAANVAETTGYVRDMLSPTRKSFWRRLLELLIPRPAVTVP